MLCLFGGAHSLKSVKFSEELHAEGSSTHDSKMEIFHDFVTFADGDYICEI